MRKARSRRCGAKRCPSEPSHTIFIAIMAPSGTWLPKYAAGVIGLLAAVHHAAMLHRSPLPLLSAWMFLFFLGCSTSACIGATLEAFCADAQQGPAWDAMLVGAEVASTGAWISGFIMFAHGSRRRRAVRSITHSRIRRSMRREGAAWFPFGATITSGRGGMGSIGAPSSRARRPPARPS